MTEPESPTYAELMAQRDELAAALEGMCDAYRLICDDAGQPYYRSKSSRYAHARALIANLRGEKQDG